MYVHTLIHLIACIGRQSAPQRHSWLDPLEEPERPRLFSRFDLTSSLAIQICSSLAPPSCLSLFCRAKSCILRKTSFFQLLIGSFFVHFKLNRIHIFIYY